MGSRRESLRESIITLERIEEWLNKCSKDEPDSIIYDQNYVNDVAVMRSAQKSTEIENLYKFATDIYTKMGLPPDTLQGSLDEIDEGISMAIDRWQQNVQKEYDALCQYRQVRLDEVQKMTSDLYLPPYEPQDDITLLQHCQKLMSEYDKLNAIRKKREAKWKELQDKQMKLCLVLGIKSPEQNKMQTDIPSQDELNRFEKAILDLEKEEQRRREKYQALKSTIAKLLDLLEHRDESTLQLLVQPDYTEAHLRKMTATHSKLEEDYAKNQQKFEILKERLLSLYDRLDIVGPEREQFLEKHSTCKSSLMAEMEAKIAEYEELKKQNIGKFIDKIRRELAIEYDRCFIDQEQQGAIFSLSSEPSEELLELYEKELERLKKYFVDNLETLEKFQKWRLMWKELIDLEIKANDPNRFNNRGGQLLAEEKKRKTLQKNLPIVEKKLIELNAKHLAAHGDKFKVFGTNLDEFITGCWDELNHAKEVEKRERQRAKMTPSKKPAGRTGLAAARGTPLKRAVAGGSRLLGNCVSLSETEFEAMAVDRPTSAKRPATKFRQ